jgi:hypothetical protein
VKSAPGYFARNFLIHYSVITLMGIFFAPLIAIFAGILIAWILIFYIDTVLAERKADKENT